MRVVREAEDILSGGEDRFLARLAAIAARWRLPRGVVGIGDDAAVLPGAPPQVLTTDLLVEGQHFRFDTITPEDLARRALEANLSDIAAMGAKPVCTLLGLAWPLNAGPRRLLGRLLRAFVRAAAERGAPLVGGDTVESAEGCATLALTVVGAALPGGPVLRSGGRPGQILATTGPLGGACTGLDLLEGRIPRPRDAQGRRLAATAVARHRRPHARLELARPLARFARAMIDISDGLGLDLPRLAGASGCGFVVEAAATPIHDAARRFSPDEMAALMRAISGGEDFELVAAIDVARFSDARRALRRVGGDLFAIGRLTGWRGGQVLRLADGRLQPWPRRGWDPFARNHIVALDDPAPSRVGKE